MKKTVSITYESPVIRVIEMKSEGVICDSEDFEEGHDEDAVPFYKAYYHETLGTSFTGPLFRVDRKGAIL